MNVCFRPTGIIHEANLVGEPSWAFPPVTLCGKRYEDGGGHTFNDWSKWVKEDVTCKTCLKVRRGPNG